MKGGKADNKLSVTKEERNAKKRNVVKKTAKKGKAVMPPKKPTVPGSGFFIFMEQFKKSIPEGEKVSGQAGMEEWQKLPEDEKTRYKLESENRMADYLKDLAAYEKRMEDEHD